MHQPSIAPDIRASDSERELIVTRLSEHAAAGRLTLAELEERIGLAYSSTTRADLAKLIGDLPKGVAVPAQIRRKPTRWLLTVMSGTELKGRRFLREYYRPRFDAGRCKTEVVQKLMLGEWVV